MNKVRSTCREYRVILFADLPMIHELDGIERDATDQELIQFGIHVFDRGSQRVQAICNGYWDRELKRGVDAQGNPWPGELISGRSGMYREARQVAIHQSLAQFEGGTSGGANRLLRVALPDEIDQPLTPEQRLTVRLPRIFGDG